MGTVSVVMTATAASWAASGVAARASSAAGTPSTYGSKSSSWPMTPVEHTSTSEAAQPSFSARNPQVRRAVARPGSPVAALALPEFRMTARAAPSATCSRETLTGAAQKRFVVKVPAATDFSSATTSAMSRRLGSRRKPAWTPAALMPAAAHTPPSQGTKPKASGVSAGVGTSRGAKSFMFLFLIEWRARGPGVDGEHGKDRRLPA